MSSVYTGNLTVSIFGQSHAPAIGVTIDGLPAGFPINLDELQFFLSRRAPGQNAWSTPRREVDAPEVLCGLKNGKTCGAPLTAIIRNTNTRSGDYENLKDVPRPGHADYTAQVKFGGAQDASGGGHFSGRLTAPMCIAGGICMQLLEHEGGRIRARILSIGTVTDSAPFDAPVAGKPFPAVSDGAATTMQEEIAQAKADGDSVGGVIECVIDEAACHHRCGAFRDFLRRCRNGSLYPEKLVEVGRDCNLCCRWCDTGPYRALSAAQAPLPPHAHGAAPPCAGRSPPPFPRRLRPAV